MPTRNFEAALRHSLRDVTLQADEFVAAIPTAWETFESKKIEECNKCVLIVCERCEIGVYLLR